jgi:hypothetical protein
MKQLTAEEKHSILTHLQSRGDGVSLDAIAAAHGVKSGRRTLANWLQRWDGTPQSLHHQGGAGRPSILSRAEISRHIRAPILAANRRGEAIHYPTIHQSVECKTGKRLSLPTIRRYGKEKEGAKQKHTRKRTASECQPTRIHAGGKCVIA